MVSPGRRGVWGESLDLSRGGKELSQIVDRPFSSKRRKKQKNRRPFVAHRNALLAFKVSHLWCETCNGCDPTIACGGECSDRAQGRFLRPILVAYFRFLAFASRKALAATAGRRALSDAMRPRPLNPLRPLSSRPFRAVVSKRHGSDARAEKKRPFGQEGRRKNLRIRCVCLRRLRKTETERQPTTRGKALVFFPYLRTRHLANGVFGSSFCPQ